MLIISLTIYNISYHDNLCVDRSIRPATQPRIAVINHKTNVLMKLSFFNLAKRFFNCSMV